jgi:hypothetical protein
MTPASMSNDRASLHDLLVALIRRERLLLVLRAGLQALAAGGVVLLVAVVLVALRVPHALALALWVLVALALPLLALLLPMLPGWRPSGDAVRQARLVEARRPGLRGRLVTLAERPFGPQRGESEGLLELAARRAHEQLGALVPADVHPGGPLRRPALVLALVALACGLTGFGPAGPLTALRVLLRGGALQVAAAGPLDAVTVDEAQLGDIVLRYRYPDYTALEPLEVPNSTGDVHAPPGTMVELRARTAQPWTGAELLVQRTATAAYEASTLRAPARIEGGRDLVASFELVAPGSWSFELEADQLTQRTREHLIVLDLDQAPELLLVGGEGLIEVAWDEPVPIAWTARDDYGLVHVEVVSDGEDARNHSLRKPLDPTRRLEGQQDFTPADLGLMPGTEARLHLQAWDNDAISGSKLGRSSAVRVRVLGPKGQNARRRRVVQQLRDALLVVLADHLEDPWPVSPERAALRAWGAGAARRMDPVEQLVEDAWQGYEPEGFEGTVIDGVRRSQAALVGFLNALGPSGSSLQRADLDTVSTLRDDLIQDLEQGVLTLDEVVRQIAMQALVSRVQDLDDAADRLQDLREAEPRQVLARLDRLDRQLALIEQAAAQLGDSSLAHFTHYRVRDVEHLAEAVRQAHGDGRHDQGRVYQDRLVHELHSFAEQFQQLRQRQQEVDDELAERIAALAEELRALLGGQSELLSSLLQAVQTSGDPSQALAGRWDALAAGAGELAEALDALSQAMMGHEGRPASEWRLAQQAAGEAQRLAGALEARDLGRALEAAAETEWALQRLDENVERHAAHAELLGRAMPGQAEVQRSLGSATGQASELRQDLEALLRQLASEPGLLRVGTAPLTGPQDALQQRTDAAEREARELMRQLPMEAPGLVEGVSRANREMAQAEQALPLGYAQEAEGAQRAAIQGLEEAIKALEDAQQDAQDMSDMSECEDCQGGGQSQKDKGGSDKKGGQARRTPRMEIPTPEEFRTPEAYRQALLEGMQGRVPPEYEALERRYYEDLVRQ